VASAIIFFVSALALNHSGDEPPPNEWTPVIGSESQERQRRSFTEDYKRQAAELVVTSGRSIASVGKELGLRDSVLRRWVEKLRQELASATRRPNTQAAPMPADQAAEIARLREENERLRMERDILKKSIAIFAGTRP
jgi:transposase